MRVLLPTLLASAVAAGCGSSDASPPVAAPPTAEQKGNVTLYVSNQSFDRPEVDIRVEIDAKVVVADEFPVEDQHNWVELRLRLADGKHVLRATSQEGDAVLERTFSVKGKRWAVVDYWCCDDAEDPRFTFLVSKRQIAFA